MKNIQDLINKRFNKWTVLEFDNENSKKGGPYYWICKCDCGTVRSVLSTSLTLNRSKSCGCLNKELKINSNRIEFDINQGCFKVFFSKCDEYFLCDTEDRDIVEKYTWYKDNYGYVRTKIYYNNKIIMPRFHRLVMEKYYGDLSNYVIDHCNHNKIDNRKYNLRICTTLENNINKRPYSNTGEKYISYIKIKNKYVVQFNSYNVRSSFDTLDEAISFRDNYLKEHPDDFRYDPNEDYINRNNPNAIHPFKFIEKQGV